MPVQIVRNDITKMEVDVIVNAANNALMGGGGVDGAIHKAAGPQLLQECKTIGGCPTGEARLTRGYNLPCRYVVHTVGPVWRSGYTGEEQLLRSCYRNSLLLARSVDAKSVAFPLISTGVYGYPKDQALRVAMDTISRFLLETDDDMMVYLVVFSRDAVQISQKLFADVRQYIDDHYVERQPPESRRNLFGMFRPSAPAARPAPPPVERTAPLWDAMPSCAPSSLEDELDQMDESFSQMVLRKIAQKGMKNAECYKKANLDKKLFSKINNDIHYKPKKTTALALAVALELPLEETKELLMKAGLALSRSDKFDIIVEYFIREGKYDIFEINEVLFYYDQPLLGCVMA